MRKKHTKESKKRIAISLIISFIMIFTMGFSGDLAFAEENAESASEATKNTSATKNGEIIDIGQEIEVENDITETQEDSQLERKGQSSAQSTSLPTSYDPRTESWFENYIKVKDQDDTDLCWDFAVTTAAEIYYAKNMMTSASGSASTSLSPIHLGYFFYNRADDPLYNTTDDKNVAKSGETYVSNGGNSLMTFQALANWTGVAEMSKISGESLMNNIYTSSKMPLTLAASLAYDNDLTVKTAEFLTSTSEVKQALIDNGSVVTNICASAFTWYMNKRTGAYYYGGRYTDHVVTIVGYDDNYSRENFNRNHRPKSDGAWIVQNSYGTNWEREENGSWGGNGYFYVSYEENLEDAFTIELQSADTYDYNYQYDGNAYPGEMELSSGEKVANVYTVPGKSYGEQELQSVGFTTWNDTKKTYTVSVYTDVDGTKDPTVGTKACTFSATVEGEGFHTFDLSEGISLEAGTKYAIVVEADKSVTFGMEESYTSYWISFNCGFDENQSYAYSKKEGWYDLYDDKKCARIKGYTVATDKSTDLQDSEVTLSSTKYAYTGSAIKPGVTVNMGGDTLTEGVDYELEYSDNTAIGKATVTITAIDGNDGGYTGSVQKTFLIGPAAPKTVATKLYGYDDVKISWSESEYATGYLVYYKKSTASSYTKLGETTGRSYKAANLADGVKYNFKVVPYTTVDGTDYKVKSKTSSIYTLKKIAKPTVKKYSSKKVKITWKNISGETGYQISRSTKKSGTNVVATYTTTSGKSKTISAKKNKKYYYKVRAYKTVDGKKIYAPWSKVTSYTLK